MTYKTDISLQYSFKGQGRT